MSGFRNRNMVNHALRADSGQAAAEVILNNTMMDQYLIQPQLYIT